MCQNMINKFKYGDLNYHIDNENSYKEFKDSDEAKEWGMKHYKEWALSYKSIMGFADKFVADGAFVQPIEQYCGYTYRYINEYLRNKKDNENNRYREMADILSMVISSSPRIPINLILYRMVSDEFINCLIKKNKATYPIPIREEGFLSTSLLKGIANINEPYANHNNIIKMYVESGTAGIYVNSVTKRSEQEMLLCPGRYLGLVKYPYQDAEINKIVYECKLINMN
jgi:hypothetical protein